MREPSPFFQNMLKNFGLNIDRIPKLLRPKNMDFGKFTKGTALLFAPDCMGKDGKYYLYFCMSNQSEGVAVSDNPASVSCGSPATAV